jgi:thiol-disulfide isomerase/thioredoxin
MRPWSQLAKTYRASRVLRWAVELAVFLGIVLAVDAFQTRGHARGVVPELGLRALDGSAVPTATLLGQPLVLVVWAPWCGVCKLETGNVSRARSWLEPRAKVISVAAAYQNVADVREYMRDHAVDYPVLLAGREFQRVLGVRAFPSLFVLDESGRIVRSTQGYTTTFGLWWRGALFW